MAITGYSSISYEAGEAVEARVGDIAELTADAAITKGTFVKLVTAGHVTTQNATVAGPVGIALNSVASGKIARVLISGIGTVTADATGVTVNDFIKPDANGKADVAALHTDDIVGIALNASGANGVAVVKLGLISKDST